MRRRRLAFIWLVAFLALFLLALIPSRSKPTSKVTWEDRRGLPVTFLQIDRYTGPCPSEGPCRRVQVGEIETRALILDVLFLAASAGMVSLVLLMAVAPAGRRAEDTRKR